MSPKFSAIPRPLKAGLLIAILLQWMIVALFYVGVLHDPSHTPGTFLFHQGGDQDAYFALAQAIAQRHLISSKYTLGYPLLLTPWIMLFQPVSAEALTPWIAFLHSVIVFPLAQMTFVALAYRITRGIGVSLISLFAWTLLPIGLYLIVSLHDRTLAGTWAVHLVWLQMLSDPPAAFLSLLSIGLMLIILDRPMTVLLHRHERTAGAKKENDALGPVLIGSVLLGLICGLLLLIRVNTAFSILGILLAFIFRRRWLTVVVVGGITLLMFVPQFLYNAAWFGSPFTLGYEVLDAPPAQNFYGVFSPHYLIAFLNGQYRLIGWLGLIGLILLFSLGVVALWRLDRAASIAIAVWCAGYAIFFGLYYYSWTGSLTRFLIPVYPVAILTIICGLAWIISRIRNQRWSTAANF